MRHSFSLILIFLFPFPSLSLLLLLIKHPVVSSVPQVDRLSTLHEQRLALLENEFESELRLTRSEFDSELHGIQVRIIVSGR